jgi:hypothetical protein
MLDPGREESPLGPDDFDLALRRMKNDLALLGLRRQLLRRDLAAPEVLALVDRIVELQRQTASAGV